MKPLRAPPTVSRSSLLHPDRRYVPSAATDLRLTFARVRREQAQIAKAQAEQEARDAARAVVRPIKKPSAR